MKLYEEKELLVLEDIYKLKYYIDDIKKLDGFGEKSANNLITAIENSRDTTLDRFIYSLSIPLIGRSASKTIAKYFEYDFNKFDSAFTSYFDWTKLDDFGDTMNDSICNFGIKHGVEVRRLAEFIKFEKSKTTINSSNLSGLTFVITGSLNYFNNRDEAKEKIDYYYLIFAYNEKTGGVRYIASYSMDCGREENPYFLSLQWE